MTTAAILLAGGSGTRMRRQDNKVFASIGGRPMVAWSLEAFTAIDTIDRVVLVARREDHREIAAVVTSMGLRQRVHVAEGGKTRHGSEQAGLRALSALPHADDIDIVAIHDTARPFATTALIEATIAAAREHGGAVPVLPLDAHTYAVTARGSLTARQDGLVSVQTPQAFRSRPLHHAYSVGTEEAFADTVETVQRHTDLTVVAVPGEPDNIKVTFAHDLEAAARIAAGRSGTQRRP